MSICFFYCSGDKRIPTFVFMNISSDETTMQREEWTCGTKWKYLFKSIFLPAGGILIVSVSMIIIFFQEPNKYSTISTQIQNRLWFRDIRDYIFYFVLYIDFCRCFEIKSLTIIASVVAIIQTIIQVVVIWMISRNKISLSEETINLWIMMSFAL